MPFLNVNFYFMFTATYLINAGERMINDYYFISQLLLFAISLVILYYTSEKSNKNKYNKIHRGWLRSFWWMRNDRIQRWLANDGKNRDISGGKRVFLFLKISYYSNMTIGRNT